MLYLFLLFILGVLSYCNIDAKYKNLFSILVIVYLIYLVMSVKTDNHRTFNLIIKNNRLLLKSGDVTENFITSDNKTDNPINYKRTLDSSDELLTCDKGDHWLLDFDKVAAEIKKV